MLIGPILSRAWTYTQVVVFALFAIGFLIIAAGLILSLVGGIAPTPNALSECRYELGLHGKLSDDKLFVDCMEAKGYILSPRGTPSATTPELPFQYDPDTWRSRTAARISGDWKR